MKRIEGRRRLPLVSEKRKSWPEPPAVAELLAEGPQQPWAVGDNELSIQVTDLDLAQAEPLRSAALRYLGDAGATLTVERDERNEPALSWTAGGRTYRASVKRQADAVEFAQATAPSTMHDERPESRAITLRIREE